LISVTSPHADSRPRDDPTPDRGAQLPRAAALITASLGFIHDLRAGLLEPDSVRGVSLDMDQYTRLFGVARIPTEVLLPSFSRDTR
jgi:carnitine O-acetyltransferase